MERGIVTSALDIVSNGSELSFSGGIPPEKCRYYALYWDKIVLTDSNIFGTGLSDEMKLLESAGIARKETARMVLQGRFDGSDLAKMHYQGLAEIATELNNKNPGQWTMHQNGDQLIIPNGLSKELVTADFELASCLPVPKADYPLELLLEFKLKRSAELSALRVTLDDLYLEISKSADIPRAKIIQIQRLEQAIEDLNKVAQQSWGDRILASRKVSLDLSLGSVSAGIATAGLVGVTYANPLAGLALGATHTLLSSLKFEISLSNQLESPHGKQLELSYLSSMKNLNITS